MILLLCMVWTFCPVHFLQRARRAEGNPIAATEVVLVHHRFLVKFMKHGDPNAGVGVPKFEGYDAGKGNTPLNYRLDGKGRAEFVKIVDPDVTERCAWWETLDYPHHVP